MRAVDLIRKKRDSGEHSREEIDFLISGYTHGRIPDYQMAAWLMATWIRGLSRAETAALTEAMLHSGEVVSFPELPGRKVDKHSTGGVGDKTSLILAPVVAAGGLYVPMISGRGLGHWRHTRQIGVHSRIQYRADARRFSPRAGRMRNGVDRADSGDCSGGQENLRAARCDFDGRKRRTDLRFDHEQEAGGRNRRAGAGCEDRLRRVHAERRRLRAAGGVNGGDGAAHG